MTEAKFIVDGSQFFTFDKIDLCQIWTKFVSIENILRLNLMQEFICWTEIITLHLQLQIASVSSEKKKGWNVCVQCFKLG